MQFKESFSDSTLVGTAVARKPAIDILPDRTVKQNPNYPGSIDVHVPDEPKGVIEVALNPDWNQDSRCLRQTQTIQNQ